MGRDSFSPIPASGTRHPVRASLRDSIVEFQAFNATVVTKRSRACSNSPEPRSPVHSLFRKTPSVVVEDSYPTLPPVPPLTANIGLARTTFRPTVPPLAQSAALTTAHPQLSPHKASNRLTKITIVDISDDDEDIDWNCSPRLESATDPTLGVIDAPSSPAPRHVVTVHDYDDISDCSTPCRCSLPASLYPNRVSVRLSVPSTCSESPCDAFLPLRGEWGVCDAPSPYHSPSPAHRLFVTESTSIAPSTHTESLSPTTPLTPTPAPRTPSPTPSSTVSSVSYLSTTSYPLSTTSFTPLLHQAPSSAPSRSPSPCALCPAWWPPIPTTANTYSNVATAIHNTGTPSDRERSASTPTVVGVPVALSPSPYRSRDGLNYHSAEHLHNRAAVDVSTHNPPTALPHDSPVTPAPKRAKRRRLRKRAKKGGSPPTATTSHSTATASLSPCSATMRLIPRRTPTTPPTTKRLTSSPTVTHQGRSLQKGPPTPAVQLKKRTPATVAASIPFAPPRTPTKSRPVGNPDHHRTSATPRRHSPTLKQPTFAVSATGPLRRTSTTTAKCPHTTTVVSVTPRRATAKKLTPRPTTTTRRLPSATTTTPPPKPRTSDATASDLQRCIAALEAHKWALMPSLGDASTRLPPPSPAPTPRVKY